MTAGRHSSAEEPEEPEGDYELLMPFVACQSNGGKYNDEAFIAGWQMAEVYATLSHPGAEWSGQVYTECLAQLDLIAMKAGLSVIVGEPEDGWVFVHVGYVEAEDIPANNS